MLSFEIYLIFSSFGLLCAYFLNMNWLVDDFFRILLFIFLAFKIIFTGNFSIIYSSEICNDLIF
jgi:hypothetical protein